MKLVIPKHNNLPCGAYVSTYESTLAPGEFIAHAMGEGYDITATGTSRDHVLDVMATFLRSLSGELDELRKQP